MSERIQERYHDLDAVRAFALLAGVVLHGVMSFMTPRLWIVGDTVTDSGANVLFYAIHIFRMTTFFVLAGFFARMLLQKRGTGGFIANRLTRIGVPLVVFWPLSLAAIIAMMIIANPPVPGAPPSPPPPGLSVATFPLTHQWFLYVLLILYAGAIALKLVTDLLHVGRFLGLLLDGMVTTLTRWDVVTAFLAVPVAAAFLTNKAWIMWFGIPTPDTGLIPNLAATAGFTTAFVFGWWLHRRADLLDHLKNRWFVYAAAALAGTWWCLQIVNVTPSLVPVAGHDHPLYAALYPLTGWSWAFALIGAARAFLRRENPAIRYLADASYWVYIVHIPVVMGLQYAVMNLDWPAEPKAAVVLIGTMAVALVTYRLFVRYSFIGTILNGRKRRHKRAPQGQEAMA